ncbi:MAG TPA: MBL fold metallo-hydrolase [Humisphaera sp.]
MALRFRVLGRPDRDNALFVEVDTGQSVRRLLFDCGDGCVLELPFADVQAVDHLFFSHLHMDHVGGFDAFFRCTFDRGPAPNVVWGPARSAEILQCRFRGFMWNLHHGQRGTWVVREVTDDAVSATRFEYGEAFAVAHDGGRTPRDGAWVLDEPAFTVDAVVMDHMTPSVAYVVREKPRTNLDLGRLGQLGLRPGPWVKAVKDPAAGVATVDVGKGDVRDVADLRRALLVETPGRSVAYLTDFLMDERAVGRLLPVVRGCDTIVCESQYAEADRELAARNHHMTPRQAAGLAAAAGAGELVLFHLSSRYAKEEWAAMLADARAVFPAARFPEGWLA